MSASAQHQSPNYQQQMQPKYADAWNNKKPSQRKKLLADAGYPAGNASAYRAWPYIPEQQRIDVMAVLDHQQRQQQTQTTIQAKPAYWWKDDDKEEGALA
jgi:hypothetical protein